MAMEQKWTEEVVKLGDMFPLPWRVGGVFLLGEHSRTPMVEIGTGGGELELRLPVGTKLLGEEQARAVARNMGDFIVRTVNQAHDKPGELL